MFFAAVASLLGLFAVVANKASYSLTFSSVLRASRKAVMTVELEDEDMGVQDPLSPYLAKATVVMGKSAQWHNSHCNKIPIGSGETESEEQRSSLVET